MPQSETRRADVVLALVGVALGAGCAAAYAAWRAVSDNAASTSDRWSTFGEAMLFPGALIAVAVAAIVWLGWKANID